DEDDSVPQGDASLQQRPADQLIERVVPPDIFPQRQELPGRIEQRRGMQAARPREDSLALAQRLRQPVERFDWDLRPGGQWLQPREAQRVETRLAAHATRARHREGAGSYPISDVTLS